MFWATRHGHPESSEAAPAQFAPLMGVEPGRSLRSQHPLFFWTQKSRCIQLRQSCFHYCGNDVLREERRKAVRSGGYIPSECPRASQAACSGQGGGGARSRARPHSRHSACQRWEDGAGSPPLPPILFHQLKPVLLQASLLFLVA